MHKECSKYWSLRQAWSKGEEMQQKRLHKSGLVRHVHYEPSTTAQHMATDCKTQLAHNEVSARQGTRPCRVSHAPNDHTKIVRHIPTFFPVNKQGTVVPPPPGGDRHVS